MVLCVYASTRLLCFMFIGMFNILYSFSYSAVVWGIMYIRVYKLYSILEFFFCSLKLLSAFVYEKTIDENLGLHMLRWVFIKVWLHSALEKVLI